MNASRLQTKMARLWTPLAITRRSSSCWPSRSPLRRTVSSTARARASGSSGISLEDPRWTGVRIVLLHMAYPYVREAAFMSAVWPQVWLDLSLALPFLGAGAVAPLTEILALAPASKLMYGSDVRGVPELFALAARWGRDALGEALDWLGRREGFDVDTTRAIARQVLSGTADALYRLPGVSSGS